MKHLSVEHRNIFQKIYDEIKYLAKLVTAGSKEARQLEAVKHTFEKIYREGGVVNSNATANGDIRYKLSDEEVDNDKKLEYNEFEIYTSSDAFYNEVPKADRSSFSRSLANKTTGMETGEIRTIAIYGTGGVYFFEATGYMQGQMLHYSNASDADEYRTEKKEYLNGNNSSRQTFSAWASVFSSNGARARSDIHSIENGRAESDVYEVYGGSRTRDGTGAYERNGQNIEIDLEEVEKIVKALREKYGLTENHSTNEIAPTKEATSNDGAFFDADAKKSLSPTDEDIAPVGDFATPANELRYEGERGALDVATYGDDGDVRNDIAPVREDVVIKTTAEKLTEKRNHSESEREKAEFTKISLLF